MWASQTSWLVPAHRPGDCAVGGFGLAEALERDLQRTLVAAIASSSSSSSLSPAAAAPGASSPERAVILRRTDGSGEDGYAALLSSDAELTADEHEALLEKSSGGIGVAADFSVSEWCRAAVVSYSEGAVPLPPADDPEFQHEGYLCCRQGDLLHQRYTVVRELGVGQSSRVYLARDIFATWGASAAVGLLEESDLGESERSESTAHSPLATPSRHSAAGSPTRGEPGQGNVGSPPRGASARSLDDSPLQATYTSSTKLSRTGSSSAGFPHSAASLSGPSVPPAFVALKVYRCEAKLLDSMEYEKLLLQYITDRLRKFGVHETGVSTLRDAFVHRGKFGSHPCLAFEVLGEPLDVLMQRYDFQGIPEMAIVRQIVASILLTLEHLERLSVTHTDLKPENLLRVTPSAELRSLLLCRGDGTGDEAPPRSLAAGEDYRVKIVDFGLSYLLPPHLRHHRTGAAATSRTGSSSKAAAALAAKLTKRERDLLFVGNYTRGTVIQTREYRAPEVILGQDFSPRADIWSLGCLTYELVTGRFLFDPKSRFAGSDDAPTEDELDAQHLRDIIEFWGGAGPPPEMLRREGVHVARWFPKGAFRYSSWEPTALRSQIEGEVSRVLPRLEAAELISFLHACLQWNPDARSSASALLRHRWLTRR